MWIRPISTQPSHPLLISLSSIQSVQIIINNSLFIRKTFPLVYCISRDLTPHQRSLIHKPSSTDPKLKLKLCSVPITPLDISKIRLTSSPPSRSRVDSSSSLESFTSVLSHPTPLKSTSTVSKNDLLLAPQLHSAPLPPKRSKFRPIILVQPPLLPTPLVSPIPNPLFPPPPICLFPPPLPNFHFPPPPYYPTPIVNLNRR
jgi:hypothetical protein